MLKQLFSSQIRVDLLAVFFMHPGEEFYLRQLVAMLQCSPRSISLELGNLHAIGLVVKRVSGKQHYYSINHVHPVYSELSALFRKTVGLHDIVKEELQSFAGNIEFAFIYGSMARGDYSSDSDVDVMIIGQPPLRRLASATSNLRIKLAREVNYQVFRKEEWLERLRRRDHFVTSIFKERLLFIMGSEDEFKRMVPQRLAQKAPDQSR